MHIEDWDESFLSEFDPEEYVANLKRAHIEGAMLYFQSHVGHCYFPTKVGHMHSAFKGREDMMRRVVELCRREGIYVIGYYSLIYNNVEADRHPDWCMISAEDGKASRQKGIRYGHCCINNPEYLEFVRAQIREMAEYFTVDGMFYDMLFYPSLCDCENCRRRYLAETGHTQLVDGHVPTLDWNSEKWREFQKLRVRWMGEFAQMVTDYTKEVMPGVSVEHNYASAIAASPAACCTELVNEACDYSGGDLYGDLYMHSFVAKYYHTVTKNPPFEYMTVRCERSLKAHGNCKSEEQLSVEVLLTAAHHGASFIIDAIDPVGTLDSRAYDRIGTVFEKQMPYEKYFRGEMICDMGVYYSTQGGYNSTGQEFHNKNCSISVVKALIEANIPVGVEANTTTDTLVKYKAVIAPQIAGISDKNREDLVRYVENGGVLYISGTEDEVLLDMLFGGKLVGYTEEIATYIAPTEYGAPIFGDFNRKYPLPVEAKLPKLDVTDVKVLATITLPYTKPTEIKFASIHSNPPGIPTDYPALVEKSIGKGKVIWSAAPIEYDTRRSHRKVFIKLLDSYTDIGTLSVISDAPRQVELVSFKGDGEVLISAVDLICTDELIPVKDFTVSVTCGKPQKVIKLGGKYCNDTEIPFTYADGRVTFEVKSLVMFDMFRVVL